MAYVLDANCFIDAKNRYYGFDLCPGFWESLTKYNAAGVIYSISRIEDELRKGNDDLAKWAAKQGSGFFLPENDTQTADCMKQVVAWVKGGGFKPEAIAEFFGCADPFLVAHAMAHGYTVVTQESLDLMTKKRVKIPVVCRQFGVRYLTLFEMLQEAGVQFVLS